MRIGSWFLIEQNEKLFHYSGGLQILAGFK